MDGLRQAEPTSKRRIWVYARTARVNCGEQANLLHTHSARIAVPVRLILDIVRLLHQTKVVRTKIGCKAAATRSESTELYWQYSPQASPVLSLHHMRAELLRIYFIATTQNTDCIVWFCIGQSGGAGGEWRPCWEFCRPSEPRYRSYQSPITSHCYIVVRWQIQDTFNNIQIFWLWGV